MSDTSTNKSAPSEKLPPLCYIRHLTSGETVLIRRGVDGWEPANTACSPACLNAKFDRVPTPAEILPGRSMPISTCVPPHHGAGSPVPTGYLTAECRVSQTMAAPGR